MCFRQADFRAGQGDVLLGGLSRDVPFMWALPNSNGPLYQITVDVTAGGGDSFSIEAPEGVRFIVRSRPFTDAEAAELDAEGPLAGPDAPA